MGKSIILDIFNGEYNGIAKPPPQTKSYKTNMRNASIYYEDLLKLLSPEAKQLLDKYQDSRGRADSELHDQYFKEGFCIAVRIFFDAIGGDIDEEEQE